MKLILFVIGCAFCAASQAQQASIKPAIRPASFEVVYADNHIESPDLLDRAVAITAKITESLNITDHDIFVALLEVNYDTELALSKTRSQGNGKMTPDEYRESTEKNRDRKIRKILSKSEFKEYRDLKF